MMRRIVKPRGWWWIPALACLAACGGPTEVADTAGLPEAPAIQLEVEAPEPLALPEYQEPASDQDWGAKVNNKEREVIEVLNVINPVAAYITTGFEQYEARFSDTLKEEWVDTQEQLTRAMTLYEDCKQRREGGAVDRQLFLDMEEVWQLLVKTGVAGVRTKSMVDSELRKIAG